MSKMYCTPQASLPTQGSAPCASLAASSLQDPLLTQLPFTRAPCSLNRHIRTRKSINMYHPLSSHCPYYIFIALSIILYETEAVHKHQKQHTHTPTARTLILFPSQSSEISGKLQGNAKPPSVCTWRTATPISSEVGGRPKHHRRIPPP